MVSSKLSVPLMYAGCADGTVLLTYVVYTALHMYDSWRMSGLKGARYNRSTSGWFDMSCFGDWFENIAHPHLAKLKGKKVLLGDNRSSHLSPDDIKQCQTTSASVFPPKLHTPYPAACCSFRPMKVSLNWWKGKPSGSGSKGCTRKHQPRFY